MDIVWQNNIISFRMVWDFIAEYTAVCMAERANKYTAERTAECRAQCTAEGMAICTAK